MARKTTKKTATVETPVTTPVQTEVAVEAVKVEETAAAVKEEVVEETAAKKTTAKKSTTTKKAVKATVCIQAAGKEVTAEEAIDRVKAAWKEAGNKASDLKEIAVYVKPEEGFIYYVVNGDVTGKVEF